MPVNFCGPGVTPNLGALVTNTLALNSGSTWVVPSGRWGIKMGPYTSFQEYDPVSGTWRVSGAGPQDAVTEACFSDGTNYRLANQTGCPVSAVVTTASSGLTAVPSVVPSAGGSIWKAVLGGAISTTVTITNGGVNFTYPPTVLFAPPAPGGVPASGYCTLSAGAVATIVVTDQGAGYTSPPVVTFVNDPRELNPASTTVTLGTGASAVTTLVGAGTITALLCLDHGQGGQTAIPTFTWSPAGPAATAVMCWSITALTVSTTTGGSGYAAPVIISGYDTAPGSSVLLNPTIQTNVKERNAFIVGALSGTALTASTGVVIKDGGVYMAQPTMFAYGFIQGAGAVLSVLGATMGGQIDRSVIVAN
jgi:hypothetical protein